MIGIILIVIWGGICLYGLKEHNEISINILTFICLVQNIVLVVASPYISSRYYTIIILIKEIYVWLLILYGIIKKNKISFFEFGCIVCIVGIMGYACVRNSGSISGTLVSIRQLYLPFVFFLLGSAVIKTQDQIDEIIRFYLKIMVISVIFGLVELHFLGDQFWIKIGFPSYARLKNIESGLTFDTGVHGAFYTWDLGFRFRRLVSFMAEPVILGQLIAFALIMAIFYKKVFSSRIHRFFSIILFSVGVLLTLAKGGILISLYTFVFVLGKLMKEKRLSFLAKIGFIVILFCGVAYTFRPESTSNSAFHLAGLMENIKNMPQYLMGRGMGTVGNLGYSYGGRGTVNANGESFIGAVIGQMGMIGIVIYGWFYTKLFKRLKNAAKGEMYGIGNILLYLNIGLFITAFVNNTAISFTSCFIYYLTAGAVCRSYCTIKERKAHLINMNNTIFRREVVVCQK